MELIGRLTADAQVSETKTGKQVTNFTLAQNDFYKPSGGGETVKLTTYIRCAYWINPKVAALLKKGGIVSVQGRLGLETYLNNKGEAVGNITCHVNKVNVFSGKEEQSEQVTDKPENVEAVKDDLPF